MSTPEDAVQGDLERALWQVIQDRAASLKMSQADVAKAAHLSQPTIGRYYRGERAASVTDSEAVAQAVGTTFMAAMMEADVRRRVAASRDHYVLAADDHGDDDPKGPGLPDADDHLS